MPDIIRPKIPRRPKTYGKGSKRRPEDFKAFTDNWDRINWGRRPRRSQSKLP